MILDPFQQEAIRHIENGHSVMVAAPTGAGKTLIAEHLITACLQRGERVIYTAPLKALSNQKFRQFQESFFGDVGILTGDVSLNPHAPLLIMTTEIFRNQILEEKANLHVYSWIIFDEIHYLDDLERGTVWEESLMLLPTHMKILALSATIPNVDDLAAWIESIHQMPIQVVKEFKRPVPLRLYFQCAGKIVEGVEALKNLGYPQRKRHPAGIYALAKESLPPNRLSALISHLIELDRLPCIYFAFSRKSCEALADKARTFNFLDETEKELAQSNYRTLCQRYDLASDPRSEDLAKLIERGIAYHHAGMLPGLKEVIEQLFSARLIKMIFTTETFALGINMPARSVLFDELRKQYNRSHHSLRTRDFQQMAGRAGRRGIDPVGYVYSRVNPHDVPFDEILRMTDGLPEEIHSKWNPSYATILNWFEKYGDKVIEIYPLSFHYYQEKSKKTRVLELLRNRIAILKKMNYISYGRVTAKGQFAKAVFGYELTLSELYEQGVFNDISTEELAILSLALVFEPRRGAPLPPLAKKARYLRRITLPTINHIHALEKKHHISPLSKTFSFHLTNAIDAWMQGEAFVKTLSRTDVDEGELVRYFRMGIQILREIEGAEGPDELKEKAYQARQTINRGLVDAEQQLRNQIALQESEATARAEEAPPPPLPEP